MKMLFIYTGCHTWSECVNFNMDSVDDFSTENHILNEYVNYRNGTENRQMEMRKVARKRRLFSQEMRNRMRNSKELAYMATSNVSDSKWCQWEWGYFDGNKNSRCCILPIMDRKVFRGQEYLGLYPYIEYDKVQGKESYDFWVCDQGMRDYVVLRAWLNGINPYQH